MRVAGLVTSAGGVEPAIGHSIQVRASGWHRV